MVDNRGFVAVVDAVERLRNTTGSLGSRQLGVGRQRYRAQLDLIAEFQDLKRTIAGERGLGGATKHEAPRRNEKGQFVKQDNTRRNEKEQFVQSTPKIEVKAAIDFDPLVSRLSKAIASEIRRQPLRIQTGFLEKVGQGLFQGLGNQFVKGLDRGTKKNIGINTESVGYGVGNFATNPVAGVKDAIKARRSWQTQNAALRDALLVADNAEKIKLDENRENVFTIGGVARRQGRAGSYVGREIKKEFGNQNVKTITVENPNTDVSLDMETIKGVYAALKKANIDNVTTGNIINGLQGLRFAVGQIDSMLVRGYNPDASQLAGQVIAAKRQNPQAKISLAGHSFGGLVVEEALAILQQAGITDVAGFGIATPDLGVGFNQQNYQSFFGEKDYVGQDMAVQVMRPDLLPEPQRLTDEESAKLGGHGLPQYLKHSAVAGALSSRLRPATPNAVQERLVGEASQQAKDLLSSIEGLNGPELDQLRSELLLLSNSLDAVNADPLNISPLQQAIAVLQEGMAGLSVTVDQLRQGLESLQAPLEQMGGRKKGTPLSRQYADRLSGIVDSSQRSAGEKVRTLIPNFKDMNLSQKRDTAAQYNKGLQGQVKAYRQAVQDGDRQLAAEIGEKLLADAQTVDQVYGDLLAALPSDYVGTKSLQSQRNQVKRIQNEVLKGDKGAGRVPVGLPDLVAESEGLAASGDNAAQSFIDSVRGKLAGVQSAGVGMGEALKAGVDESLDMHSPSEEMKDRGKNAGDSFGMGAVESLRDAGNAISAEVERIKDSIDSQVQDVLNMDFFHGTSTTGARSIRKQGIDIDRTENMMFGQGFYLSNDYTDAESFALTHKFEGRKPAVLKGRLKSKNPWVTTEDEYNAFMSGAIQRGELKEAEDYSQQKYSQQKKDEKELIQKQGFDSLFIKDRGWAVAFEPDQVEFENLDEVGRNAVESLIASIKRFLGKLWGAGESVGQTLADGTEEALKIDSPSKVYKAIGKDVIAGLDQGLEGFEGTLEEKRKLLETYVKSVIEVVYDLPKVTGEAVTPAEKVRKLFQDIGKTGTATTAQLEEAKGYFPNLKQLPAGSPAAAVYQVRENKIVIDPKRGEQLPEDLIHEYTHAMQSRFGVGSRWANKPQDYLRYQGVLGRRAEMGDPRVKQAAGRSAQAFMGQMRIDETDRRYQEGFDHIAAAEAEAYGNELGIGKERQRRGFFRAEAEEMAQQFRALKAQAKRQAAEAKQTAAAVGKGFADGYEEGRKAILERVNGFLDWLEGIPLLGQLVKWGRGIAGAIAGLFVQKEKATKGKSEPNPVQKTTREAIRNVINQNRPEKPKPKPKKKDAVDVKEVETTTPAIANVPEVKTVIENNSQDLADKWLAYVVQWSKQIGTQFEDFLDQEIQQVKASGGNVKDALTGILDPIREELDERKKVFRQAIADGDTQLAHAMAERLIKQAEELRIGYKKLAENVKFFEGRGQYRDQSAEMTKTQREAAGGYPNLKGRAKTGAWQAIAESTSDGFTEGIEGELKEAENSGYDLGEAAIKGAKKALGIKSPSREFYEMALQVVQGWNMGMEELGGDGENNIVQFIRQVDQGVAGGIDKIKEGFSGLFSKVGEAFPIFGQLKNLILGFGAAMILENVFTMAVQGFGAMAAGAFDTVIAFESLNRAFVAISGSSAKAETNLQFVANTAKKLGVDLKTAEDAYLGLLSTTRGTALEGTQTQQIFEVFSQTASVRGLSNEEQGRMFAALQQSLSKQKMSAEEVRGQLGEIAALDFQGTLARSLGVSVAQLDDLMSSGELLASDVMPKIAAQYAAENAVVANSSETTAQAIARYQNSLEQFRRSLSSWFDEAKFVFNGMAALIEWFTSAMPTVIQMVSALGLVLAWNTTSLLVSFAKTAIAGSVFKSAIAATISVLKSALPVIGTYLGQIILIQLAIDAVTAAFNVSQDRFDEFTKSLDTAKKSTDELERALDKLNKTGSETKPPTLPTEGKGVVTDQTWKPFGVETGVNLEGVRQGLGIRTLGEKQMLDFQVKAGDSVTNAYRTLGKQVSSEELVGDVTAIDEEINRVRNRRANLIKGDTEQYSKIVEEEKKLLKQREEFFKGTSAYATALDNDITQLKQGLADLDELVARDGITTDAEASTRSAMETALADLEKSKQRYDDLTNSLQKSLSFLERQMRNLNEQYAAFNENLNRQATNNRVRFLRQATSQGMGTTVQGLGLGSLDSQATQERIVFLRKQVEEINSYLTEPKTAKLLEELAEQAKLEGTDLNNSATLDRLINDISPDSGERKSVAVMLKRMLEIQDELGQSEEQLAQGLLDQKNGLFDLNRSIQDFFQQLTLQIEETRLEIERVKNQMKYGRIRQKLQQAIAPGSNTFMNGIIGTIQGIFDQAGQLMEKAIGQKSSLLQFGSEKYSLENQMLDFGRSVNGATQAVEAFKAALSGGNAVLSGAGRTQPMATQGTMTRTGQFFPVVNGRIGTSPGQKYGANRDGGRRKHQGIDLEAKAGEAVHAVMGGTIKEIKLWDAKVGSHKIVVVGSDGVTYVYGHVVPKAGLKIGDAIASGDRLASISATDRLSSGPHLHLEAWRNGRSFDPTSMVAQLPRPTQTNLANASQLASTQGRSGTQSERQAIAKVLKQYNSPLSVDDVIYAHQQSGVAIDFLLAQAAQESGIGTQGMAARTRNPLNYGNNAINGKSRPFPNFREGFATAARLIGRDYATSFEQFKQRQMKHQGGIGYYAADNTNKGPDLTYIPRIENIINRFRAIGVPQTIGGQSQPVAQNVSYQASNQPDPAVQKAKADTATLVGLKKAVVDGNAELLNQEFKDFRINSAAEMLGAGVQLDQELRNLGNDVADLRNQFADLDDQYSPQTLSRQAAAENRQAENQLRQLTNQLTEREIVLKQAIATMKDFAPALREASSQLGIAPEAAANMRGLADRLESEFLPVYQKALAETQNYQAQLEPLRAKMQEFNQLQQAIRQTNQDAELAALKAQAAAETRQDLLKRDAEIERANVEFKKQSLELSTRLEGEELDKQLKYHEQIRDAQIETANYEYESLLRARELEIVQGKLAIAVFNGSLEQQLKLELQQIELETLTEIARINREITDETTKQTMLAQTLETSQNRQKQAYFDDVNRRLELQNIERDLAARNAENRANLTTNPFEATAIREQQAIAARRAEFEQKAIELRQKYQGNPALAESLVSREAEILAQDLQLIDRQFRDVSETVGDMLSGAFNNFFTALINGENALQAFTNSLLQSITELGSQMLQQGLNGLFGGIFEGVIPGFASGGYTGNGDRLQPAGIVHAGEFVLNKKATQKIGLPTLNLLNRLPGYFDGGYVGLESRLLSGLNTYQSPRLSLPENGDRRGMAGATTNTVTVNINDKESRFYRQSRTLARELAEELRG